MAVVLVIAMSAYPVFILSVTSCAVSKINKILRLIYETSMTRLFRKIGSVCIV